jgi:hypothetical protein
MCSGTRYPFGWDDVTDPPLGAPWWNAKPVAMIRATGTCGIQVLLAGLDTTEAIRGHRPLHPRSNSLASAISKLRHYPPESHPVIAKQPSLGRPVCLGRERARPPRSGRHRAGTTCAGGSRRTDSQRQASACSDRQRHGKLRRRANWDLLHTRCFR